MLMLLRLIVWLFHAFIKLILVSLFYSESYYLTTRAMFLHCPFFVTFSKKIATFFATCTKNKRISNWFSMYLSFSWRRVRDSNPRRCYPQQFSRLPQSTALPTLRRKSTF